jgi:hypothetical protein
MIFSFSPVLSRSFQSQRRHSVRVRVYHVWLFYLSEATTGPHKANADIQCACITSHSSFCPGQRQTSQVQREHSVRVHDTASTETTVLFILSRTTADLSRSTRTFSACARYCIDREPYSSFFPGQRQPSQGQREHSVRVHELVSTETTALFILSKTATGLSGSTRTFPCVRATLQH